MREGSESVRSEQGVYIDDVSCIATAAHELKSPLALMRQLALSLESGVCSPEESRQIARQITLTSERALRLTTDLTKSVRLEDGLFTVEPLNPLIVCDEAVEELMPLYRERGRALSVSARRRPVLALANRDLLRRILTGFLDNALHYSDDTAGIKVTVRKYGTRVRLNVRDHGPALPANVWRRIEQSMNMGVQSLHARPASSGLGVYIARQFADAMQAEIGATRHRDGASFYVDIAVSSQMRLL